MALISGDYINIPDMISNQPTAIAIVEGSNGFSREINATMSFRRSPFDIIAK